MKRLTAPDRARAYRELGRLGGATALPLAGDYLVGIPPTGQAWTRRIPQSNLWVLYAWTEDVVRGLRLLSSPPVPLDV